MKGVGELKERVMVIEIVADEVAIRALIDPSSPLWFGQAKNDLLCSFVDGSVQCAEYGEVEFLGGRRMLRSRYGCWQMFR